EDWILEHHLPTLRQSVVDVLGTLPEIRFSSPVPEAGAEVVPTPRPPRIANGTPPPRPRSDLESQLVTRLTFESCVVGSGNRFPPAACLAVAQNPGNVYNPLFIFGGSGLGKTHLLHAIGHAVRQRRPQAGVVYVPAERFMNEMIYAIQHAQT